MKIGCKVADAFCDAFLRPRPALLQQRKHLQPKEITGEVAFKVCGVCDEVLSDSLDRKSVV